MPWSDYPDSIKQFSSTIQAAANERFGAAATSELISLAAKAAGINLSFTDYTGIGRLYGAFVAGRESRSVIASTAEDAQRQGTDQGITARMIWSPPWSASLSGGLSPQYVLVRASYERDSPTGPVTGIFSHQYHVSELHGVLQVMDDLQAQADLAAPGSGGGGATVTGIVSMEYVSG